MANRLGTSIEHTLIARRRLFDAAHLLMTRRRVALLLFTFVVQTVAPAAATEPTTVRLIGVIESYNRTTHLLSMSTAKGVVQFSIASEVRVRIDRRMADVTALETSIGDRAEVRYAIAGDIKTVISIHLFTRPTARRW
jgi:hypothetical protein